MYVYLIMNKDLLLLFPVKGVSFSEGYIFSFFKFFAVVVTLAFARNSFWGWDIFTFLSLFTKGWNNIRHISNMLLLTSNQVIQPLLRFLLCVMRSVCSCIMMQVLDVFVLLHLPFSYASDIFISLLLILYICYLLFSILACLHALFVSQATSILS